MLLRTFLNSGVTSFALSKRSVERESRGSRLKILIVSGFLGAGKTSFIQAMAKATGQDFVIVENDFAQENIDSKILSQDQAIADMKIVELSEGCICCSLNLDFSFSVMTIANTLKPDFLLVEPSGVAQPTNIIQSLKKIQYEKISLLAPITVVDYQNYLLQRRDYPNYFNDQLIAAGTIVLSKSEQLDTADFKQVADELQLPDDAAFPLSHYSQWSKEDWLALLAKELSADDIKKVGQRFIQKKIRREADRDLSSLTLSQLDFINPDQVYAFLEDLLLGKYGEIIRAKGFIPLKDETLYADLVEKQITLSGLSPEGAKLLVEEQEGKLKADEFAPESGLPAAEKGTMNLDSASRGGATEKDPAGLVSATRPLEIEQTPTELTPDSLPTTHALNKFVIIGKNLKIAALRALSRK